MANKCFYHSKDHDGQCSAAIVLQEFSDCELIGIDYGDEFPIDQINSEDRIIMVDYSRPTWEEMLEIQERCKDFIWIDHHKSIIEKMNNNGRKLDKCNVALDKAACELAWEYFNLSPTPLGVKMLGQYDRWDHSYPKTIPFEMGLRIHDTSPNNEIWEDVFESDLLFINKIVEEGHIILRYVKNADAWNMTKSFPFEWEGIKFICINNVATGSPQFDSVWDPEKYDAVLVFYLAPNFTWHIRMYTSKEGIDLSKIASKHGGGGHSNACGCEVKKLPFFK